MTVWKGKRLQDIVQPLLTVLCGVTLLLSVFLHQTMWAYVAVACGSYSAVTTAYESLRERSIDVNLLMLLAAIGAVALGQPVEAAGLLFLFSLSSTLEELAMARTKSAIEGLIKLRPSEATIVNTEGESRVRVEDLHIGDTVRVKAYEQIPADGELLTLSATIDEAAMTGESVPVLKAMGDPVLCGTQNLHDMLLMSVTARTGETTLDKVVQLVRDAQENKATGERISSWFGSRYTILVLGCFIASLAIRLAFGLPLQQAAYQSLILLVAMSPCALVISIPATTLSALAWAARNGILIRGGAFVEALGGIDTIALDKTGTLTRGKPTLEEICVCDAHTVSRAGGESHRGCWKSGEDMSGEARELLRIAAAAEQYSSHPIAAAIVEAARTQGLDIPEALEQRDEPGMGVEARIESKSVKIGQRKFFEAGNDRLPESFALHLNELQAKGMTVAVLSVGGSYAALGARDAARTDASKLVQILNRVGIRRIAILSGDTQQTAESVGREVGISEIHAGLLPHQKTTFIEQLAAQGRKVMMVGDGINDAPSLAGATVGVAMGSIGSDIALNAADVVLMRDNLSKIGDLVLLGRRAVGIINANLIFATGIICTLTVSSFVVQLPLWLAVLGHEGSTVLVLLNGLRLLSGPRRVAL